MNSYGLVFGGEKTSHDSGNDITYQVVTGNNYSQVVIEGDEYILPKEAMQSEKVYDFVDKLPIEMLDEIKRSENVFIQFPNLRHGDMVVCKNSVRNDDLHTIKGTAKEIANYLQGLSACRMYAKGGYISGELANGGGVEDESQLRLLTPMPPTKLGKTGIDSLTEIVGKDELREAMSGALYAGNGRIVATDAHILVVLENQNYPKSLEGTIKSLWNKVPQERLVGIPYPNWEAVVPNQQNFQTKELSIDDVLAYAYGGFLEGKKIIKEKDFDKYEKRLFKYILRLNIGNIEVGVDSLMLTRILRVLRANNVRKIVLHIRGKQKAIKITTDNKHYGLIMPVIIADKVENNEENIYVSQQIFYPISDKDFRAMSKKYGEYLTKFSKMVVGLGGNQIPTEYEYLAILRPISEAYPKENLIRIEEGGYNRYGKAVYSKPLSIREIEHFGFFPATEIKMIGTKIYYYEDFVAEIKTDIKTIYLSKDIGGGEIEMELMSPTKFLEKIKSGEYRPLNEMAEGGEITMNVPLLLRVLELAKEDVKEDKELHFIAERLQSLSKKGTLTMEDYDYISRLESNDKIQKLIAENDSNDSDLRFEQGGGVLLAPNGKPSNLTPEQWHLVRTPEFKAWFGDWEALENAKLRDKGMDEVTLKNLASNVSKVVDENGEPLVVYHASNENFTKFDIKKIGKSQDKERGSGAWGKGFYFTELYNTAKSYGSIVNRFFLDIKNPIVLDFDNIGGWNLEQKYFRQNTGVGNNTISITNKYIEKGYNGTIIIDKNIKDEIVAYFPNQIKLADGSNTKFDSNNPDIRFEKGGGVLLAPNGKPSNLTPEQWHLVRTPEFKAWFGDWENDPENASKVVDENGEPMVCNHSSREKDIDIFYGNRIFTTNNVSVKPIWFSYKNFYAKGDDIVDYKCFLNARNLFRFSSKKDMLSLEKYMNEKHNNFDIDSEYDYDFNWEAIEDENLPAFIYELGYNGYITNVENAVVVYNSNQIKLADGSNTTFDSNNPDIRFENGGGVKKPKFKIISDEEEGRTEISLDGIGKVILAETYPKYEFVDDIGEDALEDLGLEEEDLIGKIEHIEVNNQYKGKGYGRLLMKKAIEVAKDKGLMPLYLNASPMGYEGLDIYNLTSFYESFGFKVFLEQGNNNLMILSEEHNSNNPDIRFEQGGGFSYL